MLLASRGCAVRPSVLTLVLVIAGSCALLSLILLQRAVASDAGLHASLSAVSLPTSLSSLGASARALRATAARHPGLFFVAWASLFYMKASFCLPGTMLFNVIAGLSWGRYSAAFLAVLFGCAGSVTAFALSAGLGAPLLRRLGIEARLEALRARIAAASRRRALVPFLVGARMSLPQFVFNGSCPHAGVPLYLFAAASLAGSVPYSVLSTEAGAALAEAAAATAEGQPLVVSEIISPSAAVGFAVLALACFLPAALCMRYAEGIGEAVQPVDQQPATEESSQTAEAAATVAAAESVETAVRLVPPVSVTLASDAEWWARGGAAIAGMAGAGAGAIGRRPRSPPSQPAFITA